MLVRMTARRSGSFGTNATTARAGAARAVQIGTLTLNGLVVAEIERSWGGKKTRPAGPLVDTGNLVGSVQHTASGLRGEVRVGAEYAPYLEYGTRHMRAFPFFSNAVDRFRPMWRQIVSREVLGR